MRRARIVVIGILERDGLSRVYREAAFACDACVKRGFTTTFVLP